MRTGPGSLRTRVTLAVIAVLAVVLMALGIAVQAVFVSQSERSLESTLASRVQLGRQLARAGVGPQQIVNRVSTDGVTATLETRNGMVFGTGVDPRAARPDRHHHAQRHRPGRRCHPDRRGRHDA